MGEPGGLTSMGLHRVGHDRSNLAYTRLTQLYQMIANGGLEEKFTAKCFANTIKIRLYICQKFKQKMQFLCDFPNSQLGKKYL